MHRSLRPRVEQVFKNSDNVRNLTGDLFIGDPQAWQACRYLCGPPISQEDLWTLVGGSKFRSVPANLADATAEAIRVVIDPVRFPWLEEQRAPTEDERETAILATTVLWAAQQIGTERRGEASSRQESLTAQALSDSGLELEESRTAVQFIDDMPRGSYSRERRLAGAKCDVPARLLDGRLLALECKVSNGPKNGWKRVNREVGGKAETWRAHFGSQALTGVILAGVFDLSCIKAAQTAGVIILWEHDLEPLRSFVASAK
ncbi:XamI restriction endonuclease [Mycolicibacterium tokaiense]|uniref:XamI restriction endonuclease n=2 Tax=Mycolicibacterium tokaiense TaxID=39695 RepID=A0A378TF56_9MYCO|nr:XamI restriction endonuclease [Mycolicibacterium tokaiense]